MRVQAAAAKAAAAHSAAALVLARGIRDAVNDPEVRAVYVPLLRRRLADALKAARRIERAA